MSTSESPILEQLSAVRQRLVAEVIGSGCEAPAPFVEAWQLALDDAIESLGHTSESRNRPRGLRRARISKHLQAFARELAYELAMFGERRQAEEIGEHLAAIVAAELAEPAIAA